MKNVSTIILLCLSLLILPSSACHAKSDTAAAVSNPHEKDRPHDKKHGHDHSHEHVAPHGGVLATIEGCGLGHVEMKLTDNKLELWFLDGGESISRSIPIPELRFPLSIVTSDGQRIEVMMLADPLRLAGEKTGRCSHFIAVSDSLKGLAAFRAFGWVHFKGAYRPLQINHGAVSDDEETEHDQSHHHDHSPTDH